MQNSKIYVEKYQPVHFDRYYALVKNNSVMKYITGNGLNLEDARKKFDVFLEVNAQEDALGYFAVFNRENVHLGDCKLEWHRPERKVLELGYVLHEKFWGMGLGTEICNLMIGMADELHPEAELIGIIDPENAGSRKILEKAGFVQYFLGVENGLESAKFRRQK